MNCDRLEWKFPALVGALALAISGPARAETSEALRAALAYVPPRAAAPISRVMVEFVDFAKIAALTGERGGKSLLAIVGRVGFSAATRSVGLAASDPDGWRAATGFGLEHVDTLLEYGEPPRITHIYSLTPDAPPLSALEKVWAERGFRVIDAGGEKRWGRGEPLKMDLSRVNAADPFGGQFGFGSFLFAAPPRAGEGLRLIEAPDPALIETVLRERARKGAAARPDIAAMLAALDRDFSGGSLLQAWLFPEMDTLTAPGGITPYTVLLIADVEYGAAAETALVLVFADCSGAKAGAGEIAEGWMKAMKEMPNLPMPSWRVGGGDGPCPMIGKIRTEGAADQRKFANTSYPRLLQTFMSTRLPLMPRPSR